MIHFKNQLEELFFLKNTVFPQQEIQHFQKMLPVCHVCSGFQKLTWLFQYGLQAVSNYFREKTSVAVDFS